MKPGDMILYSHGGAVIPAVVIELDTPDTCQVRDARGASRTLILRSTILSNLGPATEDFL